MGAADRGLAGVDPGVDAAANFCVLGEGERMELAMVRLGGIPWLRGPGEECARSV